MKEMIAYCGLACHECPAYLATQANDDLKRADTAKLWSKQYNAEIKAENINCDGCQSKTGRLFAHCKVCDIRACGVEKNVLTCAACADYSCAKLDGLLNMVPEAKKRLDKLCKEK